ncbi:MAG: hypothetical protein QM756_03765 [Polyangiaceae bacterium]
MRKSICVCLAFALGASGCTRHVNLNAPSANAAPEERLVAYGELHPTSLRIRTTTYSKPGFSHTSSMTDSLKLADGRRVYDVTDLYPVLDPKSQAVQDIREAEQEGAKARYTFWGGFAALIGGAVLMGVDLASSSKRGVPFYAGAGLGIGGIIAFPVSGIFGRQAADARTNAFMNYDEGLRQRLDLCRDDEGVAPCH